jgi:ferredoxin
MDAALFLPRQDLALLFESLRAAGYGIVGPSTGKGVIQFGPLDSPDELPWGVSDDQDAGHYRLGTGAPGRAFAWTTAPQAAKPLVFPPRETLWQARRGEDGALTFFESRPETQPLAVIGLRGCDVAALALQDRHFLERGDPWYRTRREALLIVAVNCARSAPTCFCRSTGDGPAVKSPYDLLLDELDDGYLVRAGSDRGQALLARTGWPEATAAHLDTAEAQLEAAAAAQTRRLPSTDLAGSLEARRTAPAWNAIADQCLACGNCTAVCPSCFCHHYEEQPALDASTSTRERAWDSCFGNDHSLMHGQPHRREIAQRYRQWLSHKLGAWHSQYGRSGCTGCGRCITWCPVGIDLTVSVDAVMAGETPS